MTCIMSGFYSEAIRHYLGVVAAPVYCTKIASRLIRTYTDRHGLKELVRELLGRGGQRAAERGGGEATKAQRRDGRGGRGSGGQQGGEQRVPPMA